MRDFMLGRNEHSRMSIKDYYEDHAREYFDETAFLNIENLYPVFLNELVGDGRILDAGSGSGRDTKAFLKRGYKVISLEIGRAHV